MMVKIKYPIFPKSMSGKYIVCVDDVGNYVELWVPNGIPHGPIIFRNSTKYKRVYFPVMDCKSVGDCKSVNFYHHGFDRFSCIICGL